MRKWKIPKSLLVGDKPDDYVYMYNASTPYPSAIVPTRYGGAYEGCAWVAFPLGPEELPEDAFGSDTYCANWWSEDRLVGKGSTPDTALADLVKKLEELEELEEL
jgi:hypothetical protein